MTRTIFPSGSSDREGRREHRTKETFPPTARARRGGGRVRSPASAQRTAAGALPSAPLSVVAGLAVSLGVSERGDTGSHGRCRAPPRGRLPGPRAPPPGAALTGSVRSVPAALPAVGGVRRRRPARPAAATSAAPRTRVPGRPQRKPDAVGRFGQEAVRTGLVTSRRDTTMATQRTNAPAGPRPRSRALGDSKSLWTTRLTPSGAPPARLPPRRRRPSTREHVKSNGFPRSPTLSNRHPNAPLKGPRLPCESRTAATPHPTNPAGARGFPPGSPASSVWAWLRREAAARLPEPEGGLRPCRGR